MNYHEIEIWMDAFRLYQLYSDKMTERDAHWVFQLAFTACQYVKKYNNHPLAYRLAQMVVDY